MRPPTIRDVAERAGVSKSLVSLVLRGSGQVRPEKRQAVQAAMEELGYRPNAAARSLSERRTRTVGVLLNDLRNPWFVELLDGLNSLLHDRGLHMLLADGHLNRRLGEDLTRTFTDLRVDGLVAVGILPDPEALRTAAGRVPTVLAGTREPVLPGVDIVAGDDEHGARLATEHLIGLGHRRIAHIAGPGVVGELRRRGSRLRHLWLTTVDNSSHLVGRRAAQCLLERIADPGRPGELVLAAPALEVRGSTAPPPPAAKT